MRPRTTEEIVAHDDDREARRPHVLLRPGVDHSEARDVDRSRKDRRGEISDQRHARLGHPVELDPADGLVGRVVQVGRAGRQLPLRLRRYREVSAVGGIRGDVHRAVLLCLGHGLLRPGAGVHVVGRRLAHRQVEGHSRELRCRSALQEQHLVVRRDGEQLAQIGLGLLRDAEERLAAMADLHHGRTDAVPVEQLVASLLEHLDR